MVFGLSSVQFDRKHLILVFSLFFLLLAGSIKPTVSFFEGADRIFTPVVGLLANLSSFFALLSLTVMAVWLSVVFFRYQKSPKIEGVTRYYLYLKIWGCIILLLFGSFEFSYVLSACVLIIVTLFIRGWDLEYGGAFSLVALSIAGYGVFFSLINFYEFVINPQSSIWAGRLYGVTNHPNFVAGYSAIMLPFLIWLVQVHKGWMRYLVVIASLILVLLIFMSGSRSSLVSMILGVGCYFSLVFGFSRMLLVGVPVLTVLTGGMLFVLLGGEVESIGFGRLLSTENTREYVNYQLWSVFLDYPIWGNPTAVEVTSNSYLLVLARFGIVGGGLLLCIVLGVVVAVFKSFISSKSVVSVPYLSSLAVILPYSLFEGVLVENFSLGQCVFVMCLAYLSISNENDLSGELG